MITDHLSGVSDLFLAFAYCLLSCGVSFAFWYQERSKGFRKVVICFHSAFLLFVLATALVIGMLGFASKLFLVPLYILLSMSLVSIVFSIGKFSGHKGTLLLHVWSFFALAVTWFIGGMSLTGNWL